MAEGVAGLFLLRNMSALALALKRKNIRETARHVIEINY
ncbi:hypothetical protein BTN50_0430 [Candidatus Enterovibrio altilux]|uniref:Uncharacterized protein n=1 Tax=Candidatus Enterovibrio altilux TaxID=1927128 RepID=A0A291B7J5_9GAMM|nr:hypothetical protein BTN50_0430 [Candidatus Enterovibrio luxaltus]